MKFILICLVALTATVMTLEMKAQRSGGDAGGLAPVVASRSQRSRVAARTTVSAKTKTKTKTISAKRIKQPLQTKTAARGLENLVRSAEEIVIPPNGPSET